MARRFCRILGFHGGNTARFPLLLGSSAINGGDNSLIPAGDTTDRRGSPRIDGGIVDIGSYET